MRNETTVKMICPMDRVNRVECCNVQCAQEGMCVRSAEAGSAALVSDACITCATCGLPIGRSEPTGQELAILREENAALREDKARLEYALENGFTCFGPSGPQSYVAYDPDKERDTRYWRVDGQRFTDGRAAIDSARKGDKG